MPIQRSRGTADESYDMEGRVTLEIRVPTGASTCSGSANLALGYTLNGNLSSMRYGYGREVHYLYGDGGLTDREVAVTVGTYLADGGVTQRTLVDAVKWEPYGGLRGYRMNFPLDGGSTASLERETGAASTDLASSCPTTAISETDDLTGRLRSIRVWDGATNIYRRTYVWRGDQVERTNSCYKGGPDVITEVYSADAGAGFGYDGLGQVSGGKGTTFDSNGGPMREARFTYDARGNITNNYVSQWDNGYSYSYSSVAAKRDRLASMVAINGPSGNRVDFQYDRDGRVTRLSGDVDSSGSAPALLLGFSSNNDDYNIVGPGSDTVMATSAKQLVSSASTPTYTYWYDSSNRRQAKVYPLNDLADIFHYDLGHQLLEDRGNYSSSSGSPYPIDEYIWLGGAPIAVYRARLDASLVHATDDTGVCGRVDAFGGNDGVACGVYFLVTDHIGKPVLVVNGARKIAGAGEYDPYGNVNRMQWWWWTYNPMSKLAEGPYWLQFSQKELGMEVGFRNHFALLDTEQNCSGTVREGPSIWNEPYDWGSLVVHGGYNRGDVWTPWRTPPPKTSEPGWRSMWLGWGTVAGNCDPTNCSVACPQPSGQGWSYAGFMHREYEYRRFEAGVTPYFPPLRFPGQYHDEETDLNENQHRYYYGPAGRYLSPEPLLQDPEWVRARAETGVPTVAYAYARNNPLRFTDPDGLDDGTHYVNCTYQCGSPIDVAYQECLGAVRRGDPGNTKKRTRDDCKKALDKGIENCKAICSKTNPIQEDDWGDACKK